MPRSTHHPWFLTLHSLLLLAANAGLAWVLALWVLGPAMAAVAATAVVLVALGAVPLRSRMLLQQQGAVPLPAEHWVSRVLAILAQRAGLARAPQAWLLPGPVANALAVGDGQDGAIGVTEGALRHLGDDELAGVLAHELAHLAHGDTRLMALAAVAGRITALLSQFALLLIVFSLPLALLGQVAIDLSGLLLVVAAPSLAVLLQLALSRTREFAADRRAAELTGDPAGLARALQRIEQATARALPPWLRPYVGGGHPWLRSHPATAERIRILQTLPVDPRVPPLPPRRSGPLGEWLQPGGFLHRLLSGWWSPR